MAVEEVSPLLAKLNPDDPLIKRKRPGFVNSTAERPAERTSARIVAVSRTPSPHESTKTQWAGPSRFGMRDPTSVDSLVDHWRHSQQPAVSGLGRGGASDNAATSNKAHRPASNAFLAWAGRLVYPAMVVAAIVCVPLTTWAATHILPAGVDLVRSRCDFGLWLLDKGVSYELAKSIGNFSGGCRDLLIPAPHFGALVGAVIDLALLFAARFHTARQLRSPRLFTRRR